MEEGSECGCQEETIGKSLTRQCAFDYESLFLPSPFFFAYLRWVISLKSAFVWVTVHKQCSYDDSHFTEYCEAEAMN